jgi:hypothetical protein
MQPDASCPSAVGVVGVMQAAEFMGSDPFMAALGVRISLIAYPVVAVQQVCWSCNSIPPGLLLQLVPLRPASTQACLNSGLPQLRPASTSAG